MSCRLHPPSVCVSESSDSYESSSDSDSGGKGLSAKELSELKELLKHLTLRRQDVRTAAF
jgi:hypothetical protein